MRPSVRTYLPSGCLPSDWGEDYLTDHYSVWNAPTGTLKQLSYQSLIYSNSNIRKSFSGNPTVSDRISMEAERGKYSRRN
jgi:hypothetical protein